jgi:hypothetical protein
MARWTQMCRIWGGQMSEISFQFASIKLGVYRLSGRVCNMLQDSIEDALSRTEMPVPLMKGNDRVGLVDRVFFAGERVIVSGTVLDKSQAEEYFKFAVPAAILEGEWPSRFTHFILTNNPAEPVDEINDRDSDQG